jgi:hypothetical protein
MDKALSKLVDCIRQNKSQIGRGEDCAMEIKNVISAVHHEVANELPDKERINYLVNRMIRERVQQDAEFERFERRTRPH